MKPSMIPFLLPCLLAVCPPDAKAAKLTIQNLSQRPVVVAIRFFAAGGNQANALGVTGIPKTPPRWITQGWHIIGPGRARTLTSGNADHCFVRMSFDDPKTGPVIVPRQHGGKEKLFIHPEPFELIEDASEKPPEKKYQLRTGVGLEKVQVLATLDKVGGEEVEEFYKLRASSTFTITNENARGPFYRTYHFDYGTQQQGPRRIFGIFRAPGRGKIVDYRLTIRRRRGATVFWTRNLQSVMVRGSVRNMGRATGAYTGSVTIRYVLP